jgi:hypothetical protein
MDETTAAWVDGIPPVCQTRVLIISLGDFQRLCKRAITAFIIWANNQLIAADRKTAF